ncbi:purple acid phosphatase [Pestalotiopsis sp. 9143b]|nr:purple acid phosphatase [Pestalotiopsis sp. 9143b]
MSQKELYLHTAQTSKQQAWVYVRAIDEGQISHDDLVVTDVRVGGSSPDTSSGLPWESRPFGVWVARGSFTGNIGQTITALDVLFGTDAVDPRPQWHLIPSPLQLNAEPVTPVAKLTVLQGRVKPRPDSRPTLRARHDGKFKIAQLSDTHMVTGVGICRDAIDAEGKELPECAADPLTVDLIAKVLDIEQPDLVVLTGDQLHHNIPDSQSALFKVVAPIIERSIPFAAVFGNHDSEGSHALSRE